jgi:hypothetical protein
MKYVMRTLLALMLIAGAIVIATVAWYTYRVANFKDVPEEQWVCIDPYDSGYEVRWDAKHPGTNVFVESETVVELFALSCVANPKSNCFDNDGWGGGKIEVRGAPEPYSWYFDHESSGIDDRYRHHVTLIDDFAESLIAAFGAGQVAEITTYGRKDEVLKVTRIPLEGFTPALNQCRARWAARP